MTVRELLAKDFIKDGTNIYVKNEFGDILASCLSYSAEHSAYTFPDNKEVMDYEVLGFSWQTVPYGLSGIELLIIRVVQE